ncbi:MAG TPA: hypothetical protein VFJ58_06130 [Armatimonadota bacterium]|nr:hypothetical protein [Armatimonadota bacterium]
MVLSKRDLEREIYEGREKLRRDENARMRHALQQGRSEGEAAGIEKGMLIGQILLLQSSLGDEATPKAALQSMSLDELRQLREQL